ncbi:PIG-L family deacetylase [Streptomyces sp. NRRL S-920]|uniref:PIG-L family deacetylase n=1 Tax=Streptomyces sp. NRRL S-920 TaxID=1463921 RepID=UPI0004CAAADC|nr:ricin-type beta-trefoil lectin domain protein [Streptomyces sp. NRRL S-920]
MLSVLVGLATLAFTVPPPDDSPGGAKCRATTLVGVAHQDDDLLFINPAISEDFEKGNCVRVVYVTAGDAHLEWSGGYAVRREMGVQQAYSALAGVPMRPGEPSPWESAPVRAGGRTLHGVRWGGGPLGPDIRLVFLRLPDGGWREESSRRDSLLALFRSGVPSLTAVDGSARYTERGLVATLTALIKRFRPDIVRTQDYANTALRSSGKEWADHSDHAITARYFRLATLRARLESGNPIRLAGYEGYGNIMRPPNVNSASTAHKTAIFEHYYIHDERQVEHCPGHYCEPVREPAEHYVRWLERSYPRRTPDPRPGTVVSWLGSTDSGFTDPDLCLARDGGEPRTAPCTGGLGQRWRLADGVLRAERAGEGRRCVRAEGRAVALAPCSAAPARWVVTGRGQLRTAGGCLTQDDPLRPRPRLRMAACTAKDPGQRWFTQFS